MIDFIMSVFKGMYPYFSIPAFIIVLYRIKRKFWTSEETILLLFVFFHVAIEIFQILVGAQILYMSRRYLLPCAPIIFGWLAWGIVHLFIPYIKTQRHRFYSIAVFIAVIIMLLLIFDGARPVIRTYTSSEKKHERRIVKKLVHKVKEISQKNLISNIAVNKDHYVAPYSTRIGSDYPALAYWSGGRHVSLPTSKCDILVLKSEQKIPRNFVILFSEKIDDVTYNVCIKK